MIHWLFPDYDRRMTLSLAGVWQATTLVNQLGSSGTCDFEPFQLCLKALLETDPDNEDAVFGQPGDMNLGLRQLAKFCSSASAQDYPNRYAIQVLQLQKILLKRQTAQSQVRDAILHARRQADFYGLEDQNLLRNLGQAYRTHLGNLLEIQVMGKHEFLQQEMVAARVRTLLFAGVRFAFLWRQSGGSALHLFSARRRIREQVAELLK